MLEGHDTIIEVSNIMSFVLYTQILITELDFITDFDLITKFWRFP